jgi:hypothetical protein
MSAASVQDARLAASDASHNLARAVERMRRARSEVEHAHADLAGARGAKRAWAAEEQATRAWLAEQAEALEALIASRASRLADQPEAEP